MLASRVVRHFQPATRVFSVLTAGLFFCCGTDEAIDLHPTTPIEGDAGDGGSVNGTGATSAGFAGGNNPLAGSATEGGNGNDSGAASGGTAQAGAPNTMAGAGGVDQGPVSEQLSFCARLSMRTLHASNVTRLYDHAVFDDCRIKWVTDLYLQQRARDAFLNDLLSWNLSFWGCQGEPVQNFALIYGVAPLSAGDATLLIETYVNVATVELEMSQAEVNEMQDALERLVQGLVSDPSSSPSDPDCETGSGGAGGAGSEAGAAGEPAAGGLAGMGAGATAGQGGVD